MAVAALSILAFGASTRPVRAQAWAPRAGEGDVALVVQTIDHVGRVFPDVRIECCGTTNVALAVGATYGLTDRWSISGAVPYVFAQYRGGPPSGPAAFLPYEAVDECHCLHSSVQDFGFASHYNLLKIRRTFSLMTSLAVGVPSHNYEYVGEAVVGFDLKQLELSADAGGQLDFIVPGLSVEGHYGYTIVERALDISHNRTNAQLDTAYTFSSRVGGHLILSHQHTYGGLRFPSDIEPFPERYSEFHRLLQDNYFQAGAGVSYTWSVWDLSFFLLRTVSGDNTHDVHVYTATAGRSFRLHR